MIVGMDHIPIVKPTEAFELTAEALNDLVANARPLLAATDATVTQLHEARMPLKRARLAIDERRKELIAPALEYQRQVNTVAKDLIAVVAPTEEELEQRQRAAEKEAERRKEEERRAKHARAQAWIERFAAVNVSLPLAAALEDPDEDLETQLAAATERNNQRLAAEAAERARLEAEERERARKAEEEREIVRREREALEAERKAEAAKRAEEARALAEARAREEAELRAQREAQEAELRAQRDALAAQQRALDEQRAAAEAAAQAKAAEEAAARYEQERRERAAATAPLATQVRAFAATIADLPAPDDRRTRAIIHATVEQLDAHARNLEMGLVEL